MIGSCVFDYDPDGVVSRDFLRKLLSISAWEGAGSFPIVLFGGAHGAYFREDIRWSLLCHIPALTAPRLSALRSLVKV